MQSRCVSKPDTWNLCGTSGQRKGQGSGKFRVMYSVRVSGKSRVRVRGRVRIRGKGTGRVGVRFVVQLVLQLGRG